MRNQILEDLKQAMKNKDKKRLAVIRMIKGAIQMDELDKKRELNDDEVVSIISKQIKTRNDSIKEFEKANRTDLIDQTKEEIEILEEYMPEQMTENEILEVIDKVWNEINPTSMKDMGKIMGVLTPFVKGKADLGFVSKTVREKLNNL